MSDKKEVIFLVPRPSGELARIPPGANAIIDGMVNDATDIIRARDADRQEQTGSQSDIRLDPEVFEAGITVSGYYIEGGICQFADFVRKMVEEFGEKIKPYLLAWYEAVRDFPGAEKIAETMDPPEDVERMAEPEVLEKILSGALDAGGNPTPNSST